MLDIIAMPFGYLMQFCCWISPNYLVALLLFTFIIQLALCLIFGIKQQKNSVKQATLGPKVAAIRKKYAGRNDQVTMQKQQQEIMDLYQENGASQFAGCLPMLIQMPIIFALYQVIRYPLRYICGVGMNDKNLLVNVVRKFAENVESVKAAIGNVELDKITVKHTSNAEYEIIKYLNGGGDTSFLKGADFDYTGEIADVILPQFEMGSFDMSQVPTVGINLLILIPILIFVTTMASQFITRKFMYQDPMVKEQQNNPSMKIMTWSMPLLSVWIAFGVPAAVGIYWIYRSILATLQQIILTLVMPYPKYTEEDYKAAERELNSTKRAKKKTNNNLPSGEKKRSLHHIDDDDEEPAPKKEKLIEVEVRPEDAPVMKEDKGVRYEKK